MKLLTNFAEIKAKANIKKRRGNQKMKEHNDIRYFQDFTITLTPIYQMVLEEFHKGQSTATII